MTWHEKDKDSCSWKQKWNAILIWHTGWYEEHRWKGTQYDNKILKKKKFLNICSKKIFLKFPFKLYRNHFLKGFNSLASLKTYTPIILNFSKSFYFSSNNILLVDDPPVLSPIIRVSVVCMQTLRIAKAFSIAFHFVSFYTANIKSIANVIL